MTLQALFDYPYLQPPHRRRFRNAVSFPWSTVTAANATSGANVPSNNTKTTPTHTTSATDATGTFRHSWDSRSITCRALFTSIVNAAMIISPLLTSSVLISRMSITFVLSATIFNFEVGLHEHNRQKHPYCTSCKRVFQSDVHLRTHLKSSIHQGRTVECPGDRCSRAFPSIAALTLHLESGTCPSRITRETLNRVVVQYDRNNIITNPARLIGGPQGYSTSTQTVEMWATNRAWNGDRFECYLCHREYNTLPALNQHLKSPAHADRIYRCPRGYSGCGAEFRTLSALCQHVEKDTGVAKGWSEPSDILERPTETSVDKRAGVRLLYSVLFQAPIELQPLKSDESSSHFFAGEVIPSSSVEARRTLEFAFAESMRNVSSQVSNLTSFNLVVSFATEGFPSWIPTSKLLRRVYVGRTAPGGPLLRRLSSIEQLADLTISLLAPGAVHDFAGICLQTLVRLSLAGAIETLTQLFAGVSLPSLKRLSLVQIYSSELSGVVGVEKLHKYLDTLSHACSNTIDVLEMRFDATSGIQIVNSTAGQHRLLDAIYPLLSLQHLRELKLTFSHSRYCISVVDHDVEEMAAAWPRLTSLFMDDEFSSDMPSIGSTLWLAQHCPDLSILHMGGFRLNLLPLEAQPILSHKLQKISFNSLALETENEDLPRITSFLDATFPFLEVGAVKPLEDRH
ncbi:uncharacterized protein FIBRA_07494 [Fibroporia radiculosa]|uniref:C2H2-type domain-containing protein n=1 Tax=Fibroporia radiculosa TaxID=599839 RepID=J4I0S4_9APHY|nr:uncharacterized protein FIBRA_07494 [Fibroporia radiculosa]CCM05282.1 predicted protein [Fibroporia radiculosa]